MTRALSELLGAQEPTFRLGLRQLENASGGPNEDIRLSTEVSLALRSALRDLGLNADDTTGAELYSALLEKIKNDDALLRKIIEPSDEANVTEGIKRLLDSLDLQKKVFALRLSSAKRLLKKLPPKKVMKQLGYRSLESMLKHESVGQIYAAAEIVESPQWHKSFIAQYKALLPADFESRSVQFLVPKTKRWLALSESYLTQKRHNVLTFKELGMIILLPVSTDAAPGITLASTIFALHALNDIRSTSAYLKLYQVHADFGATVVKVSRNEPYTKASLVGQWLPWRLIQHYFARSPEAYSAELFEPHIQPDDLKIDAVEHVLAKLHPQFEFWKHLAHIGLVDQGLPVSCNITDAVLNFCNKLPYEQRIASYLRDHLWRELMLRYLHQQNLESLVHEQLSTELVEPAEIA